MMDINYVDPPNRQMNTTFSPSTMPTLYKDIIFIDITPDGRLLVGSTNVTATFWQGSLQIFSNSEDYNLEKCESFYNGPIIFDGKFLSDNKQIISESETTLKVLSLPKSNDENMINGENCLTAEASVEHYEAIKHISLQHAGQKLLTASNNHISQWDVSSSLQLLWDFTDYHTDVITGIDIKTADANLFASVSKDRRVCIWDVRSEAVASELYNNEFCSLSSVAWCPKDGDMIIVGTQAGDLYMLDVRQPGEYVDFKCCHKKNIHRLQFEDESMQLAVVGNTNELQVYNVKDYKFDLSYKSTDKHCDHIRDAKWHGGDLYTCGLQSCIVKHSISTQSSCFVPLTVK